MVKRILGFLLSASLALSSLPVLAENEGSDGFDTNYDENEIIAETADVIADGTVEEDITSISDDINTENDTDIDSEYELYDPDKEYEIGDTVLMTDSEPENEDSVNLYVTATYKGLCKQYWANISGCVLNVYQNVADTSRASYLSLGQTFYTDQVWYLSTGVYRYRSTNEWTTPSGTDLGQCYFEYSSSAVARTIYHTVGSYQSSHPHYGVCSFHGTTMTGSTTTKTSCTTCYPPKIYYSANGGSGAPSYQSGYPITITSTVPTRFPYKFKGWSTSSSASTASYIAGNSYYGSANTSTYMYAVWESAQNMTSSINTTGSTYIYPKGVTGYFKFVAPETGTYAFESTGSVDTYGIICNSSGTQLAYNDDGGDSNNFRATYNMTAGTTYYLGAKYYSSSTTGTISTKMRRQYSVVFDANGGSGAPSAQTKLYGDTLTLSDTEPTNGGLEFLGWSTSADSEEIAYSPGEEYTADSDIALYAVWETVSGQCGDDLYWTLDGTGLLTVTGTGDMWDYTSSTRPSWNEYNSSIKNIVINEGATSIGNYAFYSCAVNSVSMPNSLNQIKHNAFNSCMSLSNVIIPDGVTSIGIQAFFECDALTEMSIPKGVSSVRSTSFAGCDKLTSISVDERNEAYSSVNGVLFNKNQTKLIEYPAGKNDESYEIPDTVTIIDNCAFWKCTALKEVIIPGGVTSIGISAFYSCTALTNVTIPSGTESLDAVFTDCSALAEITIPSSITVIGEATFNGCSALADVYYTDVKAKWEAISIGDNNEPLTSATVHYVSDSPVITESNLAVGKSVTIYANEGASIYYTVNGDEPTAEGKLYTDSISFTEVGDYEICAISVENGNSESVVSERTVTVRKAKTPSASAKAGGVVQDKSITLSTEDDAVIYYTTDGSTPTLGSDIYSEPIIIDEPKTVKAIAVKEGCAISDEAVYSYSILGTAPTVLITITNVDGGKTVTLSNDAEEAQMYYTLDSSTPTTSSTLYTEPIEIKKAGVKYIKTFAVIEGCKDSPVTSDIVAVEQLDAPQALTTEGKIEKGDTVTLISPDDANIYYTTDGTAPTTSSNKYTSAIIMENSCTIKAIAAMNGYVSSGAAEFEYTVVERSAKPVITIKDDKGVYSAEITCTAEDANIYYTLDGTEPTEKSNVYSEPLALDDEGVYTIKAFSTAAGYENSIVAEETITLTKTDAPVSDTEAGKVEKGAVITLSGEGTVYYSVNDGEERIYSSPIIIDKNTKIKAYAVASGCLRSDTVEFNYRTEKLTSGVDGATVWTFENETLTVSGSGAMPDYIDSEPAWKELVDEVKYIVIEDGITAIGASAFVDMTTAVSVTIADSVTAIGNGAFEGCVSLLDVRFPLNLISIGDGAFKDCVAFTSPVVPSGTVSVGNGAFEGCAAITSITLPFIGSQVGSANNTDTFDYIFNGSVPETLKKVTITNETNVPENAFKDLSNIEHIKINDGIKTIGAGAFDGCASLCEFIIPDGIVEICDNTFRGCQSAVTITVPDTVTAIGTATFDGCKKLDEINIPNGITAINDYTFRDCASIYSIIIPNSVESIGADTLRGCVMLHTLKIPFVGANINPGAADVTNEGILGYLFGQSDGGVKQGDYSYAIPASLTIVEVTGTDATGYIPPGAFMNCANIVDILIDGGRSVCARAFENCKMLSNLYIPRSVQTIGSNILASCTRLKTLTVPFIGANRSDNGTETSVLGGFFGYDDDNITGVPQYYDDAHFHYYKIPSTLKNVSVLNQTTIPYGAFMECYSIEQVSIVSGAAMNDKAFYNCTSLSKVLLPSDLMTIGANAFAESENLENINLPNGTKSIGDNSFYNCRKLKEITIPRSVEEIADEVFNGTGILSSDVDLFVSGVNIICAAGSKAEEFAIEKGLNYTLVDDDALNIKQTSTTVELLSDNSYLFDVTDSYRQEGTLYVDVYNSQSNLLSSKTKEANDVEYRVSFTYEEIPNVSYAVIYILNEDGEMVTTTTEVISVDGGDIPEIPESNLELTYESGAVTVAGTNGFKKGLALIEAVYDDSGAMLKVNLYSVPGLNMAIDVDTDFESGYAKFMLWENLESMKPITYYITQ